MSPPYNQRVVVEKTPNAILQRFLSKFPAFADLDWNNLAENAVEPILSRLQTSDEADKRQIRVRFRQAHALGDSPGTAVLIAAGRDCKLDIADELAAKKNSYERAFWCLLEHPELFDSPRVYAHVYALPKTSRETRVGFPEGKVIVTEAMLADLVQQIKDLYRDERRGDPCKVDHREHNGVHLIHAYPSDYVDEIDSYGPDDEFSSVSVKPPLHIVYYLDESTGGVTVLAKGGADKHEALFKGFASAILHAPTPPKAGKKTYDLSLFKDRNHELKTDPAHYLRPPRVVAIRLQFSESRWHTAWFDVNPQDPHDNIYNVLRKKLRGGLEELARSTILSVELQAVFGGPGEREEEINFRITTPRWCTLEYDGKEGILRRYLRPWGIEIDGKRVAALPEPALVG